MTKTKIVALLSVLALLASLPLTVALAQEGGGPPAIPYRVVGNAMLDDGAAMDGRFEVDISPDTEEGAMIMFSLTMGEGDEMMEYMAKAYTDVMVGMSSDIKLAKLTAYSDDSKWPTPVPPTRSPVQMRGSPGPAGADGADGSAGARGPVGPVGPAGADGADGSDGSDGARGATGADGSAGSDGSAGPTGADGADGGGGVLAIVALIIAIVGVVAAAGAFIAGPPERLTPEPEPGRVQNPPPPLESQKGRPGWAPLKSCVTYLFQAMQCRFLGRPTFLREQGTPSP